MTAWWACLLQLLLARQDAIQLQRSEPWMKHDPTAHCDFDVHFAVNTRLLLRLCARMHMCVSVRHNIHVLPSHKAIWLLFPVNPWCHRSVLCDSGYAECWHIQALVSGPRCNAVHFRLQICIEGCCGRCRFLQMTFKWLSAETSHQASAAGWWHWFSFEAELKSFSTAYVDNALICQTVST